MGGVGSGRRPYKHLNRVQAAPSPLRRPVNDGSWPRPNPAYPDAEVVAEAVATLENLWHECASSLSGFNSTLAKLEQIEAFCVDHHILLPGDSGRDLLKPFIRRLSDREGDW